MLLRHLWPLRGTGVEVALALVALAAMVWAIALFGISVRRRRPHERSLSQRGGLLVCIGTLMLGTVGFVLAFLPLR